MDCVAWRTRSALRCWDPPHPAQLSCARVVFALGMAWLAWFAWSCLVLVDGESTDEKHFVWTHGPLKRIHKILHGKNCEAFYLATAPFAGSLSGVQASAFSFHECEMRTSTSRGDSRLILTAYPCMDCKTGFIGTAEELFHNREASILQAANPFTRGSRKYVLIHHVSHRMILVPV